jgi:hypothetical protein
MKTAKYRKKPVIVEAFQLDDDWFNLDHPNPTHIIGFITDPVKKEVIIPTLEGNHLARVGDWIIKGVKGEYYPCKPDIFEQTYEAVEMVICDKARGCTSNPDCFHQKSHVHEGSCETRSAYFRCADKDSRCIKEAY